MMQYAVKGRSYDLKAYGTWIIVSIEGYNYAIFHQKFNSEIEI